MTTVTEKGLFGDVEVNRASTGAFDYAIQNMGGANVAYVSEKSGNDLILRPTTPVAYSMTATVANGTDFWNGYDINEAFGYTAGDSRTTIKFTLEQYPENGAEETLRGKYLWRSDKYATVTVSDGVHNAGDKIYIWLDDVTSTDGTSVKIDAGATNPYGFADVVVKNGDAVCTGDYAALINGHDAAWVIDNSYKGQVSGSITFKNYLASNATATLDVNGSPFVQTSAFAATVNGTNITGTRYDDTIGSGIAGEKINLGTGEDEITFAGHFGDDKVTVNKGEDLNLEIGGAALAPSQYSIQGKDVVVTTQNAYYAEVTVTGNDRITDGGQEPVQEGTAAVRFAANAIRLNLSSATYHLTATPATKINLEQYNTLSAEEQANYTFETGTMRFDLAANPTSGVVNFRNFESYNYNNGDAVWYTFDDTDIANLINGTPVNFYGEYAAAFTAVYPGVDPATFSGITIHKVINGDDITTGVNAEYKAALAAAEDKNAFKTDLITTGSVTLTNFAAKDPEAAEITVNGTENLATRVYDVAMADKATSYKGTWLNERIASTSANEKFDLGTGADAIKFVEGKIGNDTVTANEGETLALSLRNSGDTANVAAGNITYYTDGTNVSIKTTASADDEIVIKDFAKSPSDDITVNGAVLADQEFNVVAKGTKYTGSTLDEYAESSTSVDTFNLGSGWDTITFNGDFNNDKVTVNKAEVLDLSIAKGADLTDADAANVVFETKGNDAVLSTNVSYKAVAVVKVGGVYDGITYTAGDEIEFELKTLTASGNPALVGKTTWLALAPTRTANEGEDLNGGTYVSLALEEGDIVNTADNTIEVVTGGFTIGDIEVYQVINGDETLVNTQYLTKAAAAGGMYAYNETLAALQTSGSVTLTGYAQERPAGAVVTVNEWNVVDNQTFTVNGVGTRYTGSRLNEEAVSLAGNEQFNLGTGHDEITFFAGNIGNDTVTANVGEALDLTVSGTETHYASDGTNVIITSTGVGAVNGSVTLANYAKNVYDDNGIMVLNVDVNGNDLDDQEFDAKFSGRFNGSMLDENITSTSANETLAGGGGSNTYNFALGATGKDTVISSAAGLETDHLVFTKDPAAQNVQTSYTAKGDDLVITRSADYSVAGKITTITETVTVQGFVANPTNNITISIDGIDHDGLMTYLDNNKLITLDYTAKRNARIEGSEFSETIKAGEGNNQIFAMEGNDVITVDGNGDNIIYGGEGNDNMTINGNGENIFIFAPGDGNDTVSAGAGVAGLAFADGVDDVATYTISAAGVITKSTVGYDDNVVTTTGYNANKYVIAVGDGASTFNFTGGLAADVSLDVDTDDRITLDFTGHNVAVASAGANDEDLVITSDGHTITIEDYESSGAERIIVKYTDGGNKTAELSNWTRMFPEHMLVQAPGDKPAIKGSTASETIVTNAAGGAKINGGGGNDNITTDGDGNVINTQSRGVNAKKGILVPDQVTINSGAGTDTLNTGLGQETLKVSELTGVDTVKMNAKAAKLANPLDANAPTLDIDVTSGATTYDFNGKDLIVTNTVGQDEGQVVLKNYLSGKFDNYVTVDGVNLATILNAVQGGELEDGDAFADKKQNLRGVNYSQTFHGSNHGDTINTGAGKDIVELGAGDDKVTGYIATVNRQKQYVDAANRKLFEVEFGVGVSGGKDTLINTKASDVIQINAPDATFANAFAANAAAGLSKKGNDLIISYTANDSITIKNYFGTANANRINTISFANGLHADLNLNELVAASGLTVDTTKKNIKDTIYNDGTAGNHITAFADMDNVYTIQGGVDYFDDALGNDTYNIKTKRYAATSATNITDAAGNDKYSVDNLTAKTVINDQAGTDSLTITGVARNDKAIALFNVDNTGVVIGTDMFIVSQKSVIDSYDGVGGLYALGDDGVQIQNYFNAGALGGNGTIETIKAGKDALQLDAAELATITGQVAAWLTAGGYADVADALDDPAADIESLMACFVQ